MNKKRGGNVTGLVKNLAKPITDELGLVLWDVLFEKEGGSWYLRVIIDREKDENGGISTSDCEAVSRKLDKLLDETDPIEQSYYLEVSSAGLGRKLLKKEHFERFISHSIRVRLIRPKDGTRDIDGILCSFEDTEFTVETESENGGVEKMTLNMSDCAYIKVNDDIDLFN